MSTQKRLSLAIAGLLMVCLSANAQRWYGNDKFDFISNPEGVERIDISKSLWETFSLELNDKSQKVSIVIRPNQPIDLEVYGYIAKENRQILMRNYRIESATDFSNLNLNLSEWDPHISHLIFLVNPGEKFRGSIEVADLKFPDLEGDFVRIFPNPASSTLTILTKDILPFTSRIFDSAGREVLLIKGDAIKNTFNISHLEKGIYFVKTQSDGLIQSSKIIIE